MPTHVTLKPDHQLDRDENPCPNTTASFGAVAWRPVERNRVLFLRANESCAVCRILHSAGAGAFGEYLHVAVADGRLIVTEADSLQMPGRVLIGVAIAEDEAHSIFALEIEPPVGLDPKRHLAAEGIATLSWGRPARLQITARERGHNRFHDLIIDAFE
ncbi:MAG: hypothetical protein AB7L90_08010 [Hyphomicrobiaceae bacterium]